MIIIFKKFLFNESLNVLLEKKKDDEETKKKDTTEDEDDLGSIDTDYEDEAISEEEKEDMSNKIDELADEKESDEDLDEEELDDSIEDEDLDGESDDSMEDEDLDVADEEESDEDLDEEELDDSMEDEDLDVADEEESDDSMEGEEGLDGEAESEGMEGEEGLDGEAESEGMEGEEGLDGEADGSMEGEEGLDGEAEEPPAVDPEAEKEKLNLFRQLKTVLELSIRFKHKINALESNDLDDSINDAVSYVKRKLVNLADNIKIIFNDFERFDTAELKLMINDCKKQLQLLIDTTSQALKSASNKKQK